MEPEPLRELLEELYDRFNRPEFIPLDPIAIPHDYTQAPDCEVAAFLAATIAWGSRPVIVRNGRRMMRLMEGEPYRFVMEASGAELARLSDFVHRTLNGEDLIGLVCALRSVCLEAGTLGAWFQRAWGETGSVERLLARFRRRLFAEPHAARCEKHVAAVERGASCKRLNMMLRWMVRRDARGVDFGLWRAIPPAALCIPLDVHSAATARALGLLHRRQNDWQAVQELTGALRTLDADDPVRFDFALFGAGIGHALVGDG